jgi:hypothetical protein
VAIRPVVIDDENPLACERSTVGAGKREHGDRLSLDREVEGRSPSRLALRPDAAAQELAQASADHEPEPGAAVSPRGGGIRLAERLEQAIELTRRDADARVPDSEVHLVARVRDRS